MYNNSELQSNIQSCSKESIFEYLQGILIELFEIEPSTITYDANLYEDLDIDSIDAVDLVVKLREFTGKKIKPDDFRHVRTVQDVVEAVFKLLATDGATAKAAG